MSVLLQEMPINQNQYQPQGFSSRRSGVVKMPAARAIVRFLESKGVNKLYGIPGAAILPLYDQIIESTIRPFNVRHEQTAVFMADGYSRATGKVGVCAVTSGPAATNLLTGLYGAYGDSIPLLAFTGQVNTQLIGKDAFQEAPIVEMAQAVTKASYRVNDAQALPAILKEAWKKATTGRQGPVLIDLPLNVQKQVIEVDLNDLLTPELPEAPRPLDLTQLKQAWTMIQEAERPLFLVGGGVKLGDACEELLKAAEFLQIPVVSTLMGKDAFPHDHPLFAGLVGMMCQTPLGNQMILNADLIVNLGGRFDGRNTGQVKVFEAGKKIIHVNIDPKELNRHVSTALGIQADVKIFLRELIGIAQNNGFYVSERAKERVRKLQDERIKLKRKTEFDQLPLKPQQVIAEVRRNLERDAVITLDCGVSQIWAAQLFDTYLPRTFFITGRAGTMGWGLGAALAIKLERPQTQVINLLGDASLGMSIQDLATAAKHRIPVVVVVLNNSLFGLIRQQQNQFYNRRWISTELDYPNQVMGHSRGLDFVAVARGMGVEAELVERPEQIAQALRRAFAEPRPYLIEVLVDPTAVCSVSLDGTIAGVFEAE